MHQTLQKFGYPKSLLKDFEHWCVLLRPAQVTLGAVVLVSKHQATSLATLPQAAFSEMHKCCLDIGTALQVFRPYDKLNYLALMMVDPQVHFHVLPRYGTTQMFQGTTFTDVAWPGPPDLKLATPLTEQIHNCLHESLSNAFAKSP